MIVVLLVELFRIGRVKGLFILSDIIWVFMLVFVLLLDKKVLIMFVNFLDFWEIKK